MIGWPRTVNELIGPINSSENKLYVRHSVHITVEILMFGPELSLMLTVLRHVQYIAKKWKRPRSGGKGKLFRSQFLREQVKAKNNTTQSYGVVCRIERRYVNKWHSAEAQVLSRDSRLRAIQEFQHQRKDDFITHIMNGNLVGRNLSKQGCMYLQDLWGWTLDRFRSHRAHSSVRMWHIAPEGPRPELSLSTWATVKKLYALNL